MSSAVIAFLLIVVVTFVPGVHADAQTIVCNGNASGVVIGSSCERQPPPDEDDDDDDDDADRSDDQGAPRTGRGPGCEYSYDWTYDPTDPNRDTSVNLSGRRQDFYTPVAGNPAGCASHLWIDSADPAAPPAITAADLLPGVWVEVQRQLPTPIPRVAPSDLRDDGFAFVQHPTFFWVDQGSGQWAPVTGSASAGGITVSVRADPVRLVVSTGDGAEVVCSGAPPAYELRLGDPEEFRGCAHRYRNSSAMADNGETYPLRLTVVWEASWSATTGEGGDLGTRETTSAVRWLPVAEIQAIIRE